MFHSSTTSDKVRQIIGRPLVCVSIHLESWLGKAGLETVTWAAVGVACQQQFSYDSVIKFGSVNAIDEESICIQCASGECKFKTCPHWTPNAHWTRSNPVWVRPHWIRIRPIQIQSANPLPEVVLIQTDLDHAIEHEDQKGCGMQTRVLNTDGERASPGYTLCFMYLLNSRSNMMAVWSKDLTRALW